MHLGEHSNYLFTMVSTQSGQRPSGVGWKVVLVCSFKKFYDVSTFRDRSSVYSYLLGGLTLFLELLRQSYIFLIGDPTIIFKQFKIHLVK